MQFLVEDFEAFSGLVLQPERGRLTDEEFFALCERYPDYRIETTVEGDVIIMPPAHPKTGFRNSILTQQLVNWAEADGKGLAFDSSAGFFLANGARRSPDAAWVSKGRLQGLESDASMWYVTPEFVVELKSKSDRIRVLREKMKEWVANGAALGWLINPDDRTVEIYRTGGEVEILNAPGEVKGEGPVDGFVLKLNRIWGEPLG